MRVLINFLLSACLAVSCDDSPCQNGCVCRQSCRDENDYYCESPKGLQQYIGKNCEFPVITRCAHDHIELVVPQTAVNAYQMTVKNGIICGGAVAPDYFCPSPSITSTDESVMGTVTNLVVRSSCGQNVFTNGNFYCQDNFVMDRDDSMIAMPIPIVKVRCQMTTSGTTGVIRPEIRQPQRKDEAIIWQPQIEFFKTDFGSDTPVRVPSLNAQNGYGYIVGEKIHVVVTGTLNGQTPQSAYTVSVNFCNIVDDDTGKSVVRLIQNNQAVTQHTPVFVERLPGQIGGMGAQGAAFSFQVFQYRTGAKLRMSCGVNFAPQNGLGRRRREVVDELDEEFSVPITIFENGDADDEVDLPIIEIVEDVEVQPIIYDGQFISEDDLDAIFDADSDNAVYYCETSLCLGPMWLEVCLFVLITLLLLNLVRCVAMTMCERNTVKVIYDE